jgi:hypothetical protein
MAAGSLRRVGPLWNATGGRRLVLDRDRAVARAAPDSVGFRRDLEPKGGLGRSPGRLGRPDHGSLGSRPGNHRGTTILLVEQNALMALGIADRGYVLQTGRIVRSGDAKALLQDPEVQRAYLGG